MTKKLSERCAVLPKPGKHVLGLHREASSMNKRVSEIRARERAATPGPWEWVGNDLDGANYATVLEVRDMPEQMQSGSLVIQNDDDRAFIAHAREDIAWLLARVDELEKALDAGRRFERAYQESLGATPTQSQWERLESLQSRFLDLYVEALAIMPLVPPCTSRVPARPR